MTLQDTKFGESFSTGIQPGFALVHTPFSNADPAPWSIVTRKYDDQNLCVFVFEDMPSAENEKAIFPLSTRQRLKIVSISIQDMRRYLAVMEGVCPQSVLIFLRDVAGRFAKMKSANAKSPRGHEPTE